METFHSQAVPQTIDHCLQGNRQRVSDLASLRVRVCLKPMRQHFVQTDVGLSYWPFVIGEVFAIPGNFCDPEAHLTLLHCSVSINSLEALDNVRRFIALCEDKFHIVGLFEQCLSDAFIFGCQRQLPFARQILAGFRALRNNVSRASGIYVQTH
jgi:hypothetical protein